MILFCKAIKFALKEVILTEICVKICKKSGKFAQNGQEKKTPKRAKSGKNESNLVGQPCPDVLQL